MKIKLIPTQPFNSIVDISKNKADFIKAIKKKQKEDDKCQSSI